MHLQFKPRYFSLTHRGTEGPEVAGLRGHCPRTLLNWTVTGVNVTGAMQLKGLRGRKWIHHQHNNRHEDYLLCTLVTDDLAYYLINPQDPLQGRNIITLILQLRRLKLKQVKQYNRKWQVKCDSKANVSNLEGGSDRLLNPHYTAVRGAPDHCGPRQDYFTPRVCRHWDFLEVVVAKVCSGLASLHWSKLCKNKHLWSHPSLSRLTIHRNLRQASRQAGGE